MIKLAVSGARGRMGQRIIALAQKDSDFKVICALERDSHLDLGKTIDGLLITDSYEGLSQCDCIIDFSEPRATIELLSYALKFKKYMVVGTTGLDQDQQNLLLEASRTIPILFSPNMSVGVNVLFRLLSDAAHSLRGYRIYVEEAHHIHKQDAPSGTAKKMVQILNAQNCRVRVEDVKSIREGEIIGDHKVIFESNVDKIELSHCAKNRDIFAQGALVAARWLSAKKPRLYSMDDVLFT
jgi:4-hydroxy-tetrahydrodipicolinate reductase